MAPARQSVLVGAFCLGVFCIASWKYSIIRVRDLGRLGGRTLLLLAVCTWMLCSLYPKLKALLCPPRSPEAQMDEGLRRFQVMQARREQQHKHTAKASAYEETVLKPRREEASRKRVEDLYRMSRESWKLTQGFRVGGEGEFETNTEEDSDETPTQRAARKRKQLETPRQAPVQEETPKEKKIIILPDEPSENAEGVVKIALRCPSGRVLQRRFLKTCRSTVLLDWLHKSGYSPTIYTLFTSYPRMPLLTRLDLSIEKVGIVADTALNVGEKDPSTT